MPPARRLLLGSTAVLALLVASGAPARAAPPGSGARTEPTLSALLRTPPAGGTAGPTGAPRADCLAWPGLRTSGWVQSATARWQFRGNAQIKLAVCLSRYRSAADASAVSHRLAGLMTTFSRRVVRPGATPPSPRVAGIPGAVGYFLDFMTGGESAVEFSRGDVVASLTEQCGQDGAGCDAGVTSAERLYRQVSP